MRARAVDDGVVVAEEDREPRVGIDALEVEGRIGRVLPGREDGQHFGRRGPCERGDGRVVRDELAAAGVADGHKRELRGSEPAEGEPHADDQVADGEAASERALVARVDDRAPLPREVLEPRSVVDGRRLPEPEPVHEDDEAPRTTRWPEDPRLVRSPADALLD